MLNEQTTLQQKAFEIIISNIDSQMLENISTDSELEGLGLDSIKFIGIVVALEEEFKFEFDDKELFIEEFPTIKSIIDYVETKAH